ncbi:MAG: right-handed parallel beta-helix repeat-containing protein [Lachnospiraceae bacterium]|nr:right-handed parallel beta-helix repeat-containing protein [Lachnospiraceae bacterium]
MQRSYMKRFAGILAGLLIISMLSPKMVIAANPERASSVYRAETVLVTNTAELIEALEDNTTLVLEPGIYNITEFINSVKNPAVWDYVGDNEKGVYVDNETDGPQLMINGYENVSIVAASSEAPASIVCEPRYAAVLNFVNCNNITLSGLSMGHTPDQGYCSGEVLSLSGCTNVRIDRTDLYGCGTYGFEIDGCENVEVNSCDIHDCTYGCATMYNSQAVRIVHTGFHDCKEFTMFELIGSSVDFIGCYFYNLDGKFIYSDYSDATFTACDLEPSMEKELKEYGFLSDDKAEEKLTEKEDDKSSDTKEDEKKEEPEETKEVKDLSEKELKELSDTVGKDYNGFFCTTYARPEEIEWNEVFYNGAGIDIDIYADENSKILEDFLADNEYESQEDMMTDVTVINEKDVEDYVKKTSGLSYEEAWCPLTWMYLYDDEVYYSEHGDTNFKDVEFTEGVQFGDCYRVTYPTYDFMYEDREYTATFEKTGNGWHFISNVPTDWLDTETEEVREDLPITGFYGSVIRNYLKTLKWEPDENEMYYNNVSASLLYLFDDVTYEDGPGAVYDRVGLYFKDLNGDGTDELIIGTTGEGGSYDNIYQIYVDYEGAPEYWFEAPFRGESALTADGQIAEMTASSLLYMSKLRYEMRDDNILWMTSGGYMEDILYWEEGKEGDKHFYAFNRYEDEDADWMEAEIKWDEITEEEFDEIDVLSGCIHIPYQLTLAEADPGIQSSVKSEDFRLGYMAGLGDSNKDDSWINADEKEYVDAYDFDGIDIRLGRLPWLESIDDIGDVIEEQLGQKPSDIKKTQLKEDIVKSLYGVDFVIYEVDYKTEADDYSCNNYDLVFMAPEAMYWFHAGMPEDMADRFNMETVEDIKSQLVIEKMTDDYILGDYEPKG